MMENKEIEEGNRLIAEFMGYKYFPWNSPDTQIKGIGGYWAKKDAKHHSLKINVLRTTKNKLCYHSSWDWLMPVLEKIEKHGTIIEISLCLGKSCRITKGNFKTGIQYTKIIESNSTIESVYISVVEFIKWYNTNKKGE